MNAHDYADRIASYVIHNFGDRGVTVYREVPIGKSIIGKNRRVDVFIIEESSDKACAIECKYQDVKGTTDEKIPYALEDMRSLPLAGCVAYAGSGWSEGVLHMLQASEIAASCLPEAMLARTRETAELDHLLAMNFGWWDVLLKGKKPFMPREM